VTVLQSLPRNVSATNASNPVTFKRLAQLKPACPALGKMERTNSAGFDWMGLVVCQTFNLHRLFLPIEARNNIQPGPPFSCMMIMIPAPKPSCIRPGTIFAAGSPSVFAANERTLILPFTLRQLKRKQAGAPAETWSLLGGHQLAFWAGDDVL
jgi:hypothetical protein